VRRALAVAVIASSLAACKDEKPKPVTVAGYTFTVAGWEPNVKNDEKSHLQTVKWEAFSSDCACLFQVIDLPGAKGEGVEKEWVSMFKGHDLKPASLDTALGAFTGHTFDGQVPTDTVTGKVAQLAGTPHVELIWRNDGDKLLVLTVSHFGDDEDGKKSADKCLKMLGSVVRAAK
jgi:hypothetical protein